MVIVRDDFPRTACPQLFYSLHNEQSMTVVDLSVRRFLTGIQYDCRHYGMRSFQWLYLIVINLLVTSVFLVQESKFDRFSRIEHASLILT